MENNRTDKPNVLFVIMHDFGPRYGCYGDPVAVTPNLDRIAGEGMRFSSHYCNYPLCGPARANLFSGYRPEITQRFNNQPFFERFREQM
jgi:iduronate 2-sulfatase